MAAMDMHSRISHNVSVLMAVRQIHTQQDLAKVVGIAQPELSKRLRGSRQWRIDDLVKLAGAFGLEPADLLRPVHEVVGAVTATGTGADYSNRGDTPRREGIMEGIKHPYSPAQSPPAALASGFAGRRKGHLTLLPAADATTPGAEITRPLTQMAAPPLRAVI